MVINFNSASSLYAVLEEHASNEACISVYIGNHFSKLYNYRQRFKITCIPAYLLVCIYTHMRTKEPVSVALVKDFLLKLEMDGFAEFVCLYTHIYIHTRYFRYKDLLKIF